MKQKKFILLLKLTKTELLGTEYILTDGVNKVVK